MCDCDDKIVRVWSIYGKSCTDSALSVLSVDVHVFSKMCCDYT